MYIVCFFLYDMINGSPNKSLIRFRQCYEPHILAGPNLLNFESTRAAFSIDFHVTEILKLHLLGLKRFIVATQSTGCLTNGLCSHKAVDSSPKVKLRRHIGRFRRSDV